jgi:hypothetical protein
LYILLKEMSGRMVGGDRDEYPRMSSGPEGKNEERRRKAEPHH